MNKRVDPNDCFQDFPFLGNVIKNIASKGFLYIGSASFKAPVFAHYKDSLSGSDCANLSNGSICFFRSKKTEKGDRAISWVPYRDIGWATSSPQTKKAYDEEREKYLSQLPFERLEQLTFQESEPVIQPSSQLECELQKWKQQRAKEVPRQIKRGQEDDPILYRHIAKRIKESLRSLDITDPKFLIMSKVYRDLSLWESENIFEDYEELVKGKLRGLDVGAQPYKQEHSH